LTQSVFLLVWYQEYAVILEETSDAYIATKIRTKACLGHQTRVNQMELDIILARRPIHQCTTCLVGWQDKGGCLKRLYSRDLLK
jgi:hypothetical protein